MTFLSKNHKSLINQNKDHPMIGVIKKYIKDQNILNFDSLTFEELEHNANLWQIEKNRGWDLSKGIKFVKNYGKYNLILLETLYSQKCEGFIMKNCLQDALEMKPYLYSLRNQENRPILTFELNPISIKDNQVKGSFNSKVSKRYMDIVVQILQDMNISFTDSIIADMNWERITINNIGELPADIIKNIHNEYYIAIKRLTERNILDLVSQGIINIEKNLFLLDFLLTPNLIQDNAESFFCKLDKLDVNADLLTYCLVMSEKYSAITIKNKLMTDYKLEKLQSSDSIISTVFKNENLAEYILNANIIDNICKSMENDDVESFSQEFSQKNGNDELINYCMILAVKFSAKKIFELVIMEIIRSDSYRFDLNTVYDICEDWTELNNDRVLAEDKWVITEIIVKAYKKGNLTINEVDLLNAKYRGFDNILELVYNK